MADNEEGEEYTSHGNEWEVVSLTASAYAAAPGLEYVELNDIDKGNTVGEDEADSIRAMFKSGHFVFPPSQHENLPLEAENSVTLGIEDDPELGDVEGGRLDTKDGASWISKGLAVPNEVPGIQFLDERGNRLSIQRTEFKEASNLQGINFTEIEQSMYGTEVSSLHCETTVGDSTASDGRMVVPEHINPSEGSLDSDISQLPKPTKGHKYVKSELPSETWWKSRAASIYAHAKEANAFWSVFIAAAMMGIVILGQHWQQERWQVLQLKWQFSVNDEKMGRMLGPISRFKDGIVGDNRRAAFIRSSSTTER